MLCSVNDMQNEYNEVRHATGRTNHTVTDVYEIVVLSILTLPIL